MLLTLQILTNTGIGQDAAAMCVYEVLLRCGRWVKDATYAGTSGWSPQLGGILNNGTCEGGQANANGKITRWVGSRVRLVSDCGFFGV